MMLAMTRHTWRAVAPALLALTLAACSAGGDGADMSPTSTPTVSASESPTPTAAPSPSPTPSKEYFRLGDAVTFAEITLTVNSVEVVPSIVTNDGGSIEAAAGEQFVLLKTHFVNEGSSTVDLSCSGPGDSAFIQVWDTDQNEMAAIYDTYKIPGNPECNAQLLSGQSHDWNFAYRSVEGKTPMALTITDMRTVDDVAVISLMTRVDG